MKECGCHGMNDNCTFCNGSGYRQVVRATPAQLRQVEESETSAWKYKGIPEPLRVPVSFNTAYAQ